MYDREDGFIKKCTDGKCEKILNKNDIKLRGVHNYENICSALAATETVASKEAQIEAVKNFKGVEHRLEFVREINDVKWYNDSIASTPTRTMAGLKAFDKKIILIAGGYDKHIDYDVMGECILEKVKSLILVGDTSDKIENAVKKELNKKNNNEKRRIAGMRSTSSILYYKKKKNYLQGRKIRSRACRVGNKHEVHAQGRMRASRRNPGRLRHGGVSGPMRASAPTGKWEAAADPPQLLILPYFALPFPANRWSCPKNLKIRQLPSIRLATFSV